jgi:hypothetical protein
VSSDLGAATGVGADEIGVSAPGVDCISSAFKVQISRVYMVHCSLFRAPFEMTSFPLFAMCVMFSCFEVSLGFRKCLKCTNDGNVSKA